MDDNCISTPQSKKNEELVNLTITNTPMPQASSTVERKPAVSKLYNKLIENEMHGTKPLNKMQSEHHVELKNKYGDINISLNSRNSAAESSLGILQLDQIDTLDESCTNMSQANIDIFKIPNIPINSKVTSDKFIVDRLEIQRKMAEKTLRKANSRKSILGNSVGNLPSYLLKPNSNMSENQELTPTSIEYTSDIENLSCTSKFSKIIESAYEDIKNNMRKASDFENSSVSSGKHIENISDIISNISFDTSSYGGSQKNLLIEQLKNESFLSGDNAMEKILQDEKSWMGEKGIIVPIEKSSILSYNSSNSSLRSNDPGESIGAFFSRKTEKLDELDLKESPEKNILPKPLIEESMQQSVCSNITNCVDDSYSVYNDSSKLTIDSIMSVSKIAEVLNKHHTPEKFLDILLKNHRKKIEKTLIKKRMSVNTETITFDENVPEKLESKYTSRNNIHEKKSFDRNTRDHLSILKDKINIDNNSQLNKSKKSSPLKLNSRNNVTKSFIQSVTEDESSSGIYCIDSSTLTESTDNPSKSFAQLDVSAVKEDIFMSSNVRRNAALDHWIEVQSQNHEVYTNIPTQATITLKSSTHRWILVTIVLKELRFSGGPIISNNDDVIFLKMANKQHLIEPNQKFNLNLNLTAKVSANIVLTFELNAKDVKTNTGTKINHELLLIASDPEISFPAIEDSTINFDLIGEECSKEMSFPVVNKCAIDITLRVLIEQKYCSFPVFQVLENNSMKSLTNIKLSANETKLLKLNMKAPSLIDLGSKSQLHKVSGKLKFYMESFQTSHLLHEFDITGDVGQLKLHFRNTHLPLIIKSGEVKTLTMDNAGIVTLDLNIIMINEQEKYCKDMFKIEPTRLSLMPRQSGSINVSFKANVNSSVDCVNRSIIFQHHQGPGFKCPLQGIRDDCTSLLSKKLYSSSEISPQSKIYASNSSKNYKEKEALSPQSLSKHSNYSPNSENKHIRSSNSSSKSSDNGISLDGKLLIDSTRTRLIWGCVKLGKSSALEFSIRNRSHQRVKIHAYINSPDFKIQKDGYEKSGSIYITLLGNESRSLTVIFSPNQLGACVGKLTFSPYNSNTKMTKKSINLYGYGGNVSIDFENITRDVSGHAWLSLGQVDSTNNLNKVICIYNKGMLPAFAVLKVAYKELNPFMESKITITPNYMVLQPGERCPVNVDFSPRRSDLLKLVQKKEIVQIASLNIITGSEATRFRIKRLREKHADNVYNDILISLCESFPGEQIPKDIMYFKEDINAMSDLYREITNREVFITIERNLDMTFFEMSTDVDETSMFQTICSDQTTILNATACSTRRLSGGICHIKPSSLLLTPVKLNDILYIFSTHSRVMPYEIIVHPSGILNVTPSEGVIAARGTATLNVSCSKVNQIPIQELKLMVYLENDMIPVNVKIICERSYHMRY